MSFYLRHGMRDRLMSKKLNTNLCHVDNDVGETQSSAGLYLTIISIIILTNCLMQS